MLHVMESEVMICSVGTLVFGKHGNFDNFFLFMYSFLKFFLHSPPNTKSFPSSQSSVFHNNRRNYENKSPVTLWKHLKPHLSIY